MRLFPKFFLAALAQILADGDESETEQSFHMTPYETGARAAASVAEIYTKAPVQSVSRPKLVTGGGSATLWAVSKSFVYAKTGAKKTKFSRPGRTSGGYNN